MVAATLGQAVRFELIHEVRPEEDRAIVDGWFKVMRVRAQQNSTDRKIALQLQREEFAAAAVAASASEKQQGDSK
jgi:hypothetical protein